MNVTGVKQNPKNEKQAFVRFDDGTEAWTPEYDKALKLIGQVVPEDWTIKDGQFGKQLLPPRDKKQGGGGGYKNSKEGFDREQDSINHSVALKAAVDFHGAIGGDWSIVLETAKDFYQWLSVGRGTPSPGADDPKPTTSQPVGLGEGPPAEAEGGGAESPTMRGPASPSEDEPKDPSADHEFVRSAMKTASGSRLCKVCRTPEPLHA